MDETLRGYFSSMWRHKFVVGLAVVLAVAASIWVFSQQQAVYTASANLGPSDAAVLASAIQGNAPPVASVAELSKLANTGSFALRVVRRAGVSVSPEDLLQQISVQQAPDGQAVLIRVNDKSSGRAIHLANTIASELIASDMTDRAAVTRQLTTTLEKYILARRNQATALASAKAKAPLSPGDDLDLTQAESSYSYLSQRLDDLTMGTVGGPTLQVWQPASISSSNVPSRVSFVLLGAMIGFVVGGIGAVGMDRATGRIQTPDDFSAVLKTPVLGVIPRASNRSGSHDLIVERRRLLVAQICHELQDAQMRAVLLTPVSASPDSTVLLANLAAGISRTGRWVCLICADPTDEHALQQAFGVAPERVGLAEVLRGEARVTDVLAATNLPGLLIVPAGSGSPAAGSFMESAALKALIAELEPRCEIILVATDSLDVSVDGVVALESVDGVVLVGALHDTPFRAGERARTLLKGADAKILGVALYESPLENAGADG